jgi:hypothetical protein
MDGVETDARHALFERSAKQKARISAGFSISCGKRRFG